MKTRYNFKLISGFTLVELLIAVSIIGILVAIGTVSYSTVNKQSRDTKRKSDMEQIRSALEMYRADNGYYPSAGCAAASCGFYNASVLPLTPTYLPAIPTNPKGREYRYQPSQRSGGNYYAYCLSALLESENPADTCAPDTGDNYGLKNP